MRAIIEEHGSVIIAGITVVAVVGLLMEIVLGDDGIKRMIHLTLQNMYGGT